MSDVIINVEGLGKSYRIGIQQEQYYTALRDVLAQRAKGFFRGMRHAFSGNWESGYQTDEFWALKDISFEIKKGEAVGVIGSNGAGKSTLLKVLSRITEPTRGRVTLDGRVASLLEVGTGFHPELTGRENIYLNGSILGMTRNEIKVKFDEIVDFSGVEKFLDTPVKRYSSGMYVRLAFAVAAHLEPEILVVDEVLAVGDAEFQKKCLGKMDDVSKQDGRTVLFVSHNMGAIQNLCKKAVYLKNGRIRNIGDTQKIIEEYISEGTSDTSIPWNGEHEQNKFLKIRSIAVQKQQPESTELYIDQPVRFIIDLDILTSCSGVAFEVFAYTAENTAVFSAFTDTMDLKPGRTQVEGRIPADIFNTGYYNLTIGISKNFTFFIVKINEALKFRMLSGNSGLGWQGTYPGVLRPKLSWTVSPAEVQRQ